MELAELVRAAGVSAELRGDGTAEISNLAYDSRAVGAGTLFFCVPGSKSDGHEFASGGRRGRCERARRRAPAGSGGSRGRGGRRAGRDGAAGRRLPRRPDDGAGAGRRHRHERQDDHGIPRALAAGGRGAALRAARHRAARGRGRGRGGRANHPGGDRPAGDLRAHARVRGSGLRDGGLLARAGAAPRRRDPLRRQGLHQPDPGPPGLPRRHGGLLRGQAPAVLGRGRLAVAGDRGRHLGRQRRRRLRAPARRRAGRGELRRGAA